MLDVSDYENLLSGDSNQLVGAKNKTTFLDADTIREEGNDLDVRFGGIDAPETYKTWQGLSASQDVGAVQTAEQVQALANQLGYTEVRRRFNPDGTPEMDATKTRQMGDLVHPETGKSFSRELAINGVVDIAEGYDPGNMLLTSKRFSNFLKGPRADQTDPDYQPNEFDKARMMIQEGVNEERRFAQQFKRAQKFSGEIGMLDEQIKMVEDGLSEMRESGEEPTDQDLVGLQMLKKQRAAINEAATPELDYYDRDDVTGRANNPMTVAWETGWNSVAQSAYALADMLGEKIDWEAAENFGEAGMRRAQARMGDNGKIITDYKDVDGFLTAVEFLGTNAAMSLPYMAASGGAALLSGVTGGASILLPVSMYTGNTWAEMEGDNKSATVAIAAGTIQAVLDRVGIQLIFRQGITPKAMYKDALTALTSKGMGKEAAEKLLLTATRKELAEFAGDAAKVARQQITGKAIFKDLATRGLIGGTGEGVTEAMQEATAYLGATLGSDKVFDYNELTDRMIAASIAGTSLGTAFSVPGAAVNAGAWADVAVRQLPAEAKRLSEEGAQAEAERTRNGQIAYNEAKAAEEYRRAKDEGYDPNNPDMFTAQEIEAIAEQARIDGSRVKTIEENLQDLEKEIAERKEADPNYKPAELNDRTEAHRKAKSERTLGETIGEMFASAPALWRRSIDYIIPAEVKRISASARILAAQFGGGLQKIFSSADFEMAKRNRVSVYRNMLQNPADFWNVMGNGRVLSQKEIDTLSDDLYRRLEPVINGTGPVDISGLNQAQQAAVTALSLQMDTVSEAMYDDQIKAGGELNQRKHYLHRFKTLNKVAVQKNRNEFEALLVKTYPQISPGDAKILVDEILNSDTITDIDEAGAVAGIEFLKGFDVTKGGIVPGSHRKNTLGMSEKKGDDGELVFKDFMERDIYKNIQHSIKSAARFTAHRDYIGKNGEKVAFLLDKMQAEGVPAAEVNRIAKLMQDYLNAESGNYKRPTSDMGKMLVGIQKNLMFLTTIGTLGMAAVSSLPELALSSRALTAEQIFKRKGSSSNDTSLQNFGKELASGLSAAIRQTGSVITRREQALGNIDPSTGVPFASRSRGQDLRRELGYDAWELGAATVTGVSEMNPSHQRFYEIFFKATGLTGFTNMTRSMRAAISADYIFDHVNIIVDQRTSGEVKTNEVQQSEEALRNIGINVDDMAMLFTESRKRDAVGDTRTQEQIQADDKLMQDNLRIGSMNFIDDAIALPGVANRPLIYQDPRFFLFTQFQGFIATFTANHIPKLWGEYVKRGTPAMKYNAFAIMATMIMMGFASQYLKDLIKYGGLDEDEYKTGKNPHLETEEYIQRGIRSSGLLGVGERVLDQFFPIYEQRSGNAGEWLWNTTTGEAPATGTLKRIGRAIGKTATGDFAGGAQEGSRLIPALGVTGGFSRVGDFAPDSWNYKGE
tara:strand:- start:4982 stop:9292 length:4311 start_codon:yes stop_codon:yes gene_type:complete